jgi:hypothetical protein
MLMMHVVCSLFILWLLACIYTKTHLKKSSGNVGIHRAKIRDEQQNFHLLASITAQRWQQCTASDQLERSLAKPLRAITIGIMLSPVFQWRREHFTIIQDIFQPSAVVK